MKVNASKLEVVDAKLRAKNGMADIFTLGPHSRDELEKIAVRILELASRCVDAALQYELMLVADGLVKIIDEIKEANTN